MSRRRSYLFLSIFFTLFFIIFVNRDLIVQNFNHLEDLKVLENIENANLDLARIYYQNRIAVPSSLNKSKIEHSFVNPDLKTVDLVDHEDQYCIGYNFLEATESFRLEDGLEPVTLATHGTPDMIENFENMPEMWDGPISIGVFLDLQTEKTLEYLANFHRCYQEFRKKVTVHFAFRKSPYQKNCSYLEIPLTPITCGDFLAKQVSIRSDIPGSFTLYPINLLRNVVRWGAKSDLHFVMDADFKISLGMAQKVKLISNEMLGNGKKNVLLVRKFETIQGSPIPKNVNQLEESMKNQITFEFHHAWWFEGHQIENLPKWINESQDSKSISSWEISYAGFQWEPQAILHRDDPYTADYFPSRLLDAQSQVYKFCRANYRLNLLSHVFTVHEGVKTDNTAFSKEVFNHQKKFVAEKAAKRYHEEIDRLYPDTKKKCGPFAM